MRSRLGAVRPSAVSLNGPSALGLALAVGFTAVVGGVLLAGTVHFGASLFVHHRGPMTSAERLKAENDVRASLFQLVGGMGLVGGLLFTVRTFSLTRHTQRTDRFAMALDQIGSKHSEAVRVGGIYALWLLANEAGEYWAPTEEVLSALIRQVATPGSMLSGDVQTALTVLGRRPNRKAGDRGVPVDLRGINVSGADLAGANLERVRLDGACLTYTNLIDASLIRARLINVNLDYADLKNSDLTNAKMAGARLRHADLFATILAGADIGDCDFTDARNLTAAQLASAEGSPKLVT